MMAYPSFRKRNSFLFTWMVALYTVHLMFISYHAQFVSDWRQKLLLFLLLLFLLPAYLRNVTGMRLFFLFITFHEVSLLSPFSLLLTFSNNDSNISLFHIVTGKHLLAMFRLTGTGSISRL